MPASSALAEPDLVDEAKKIIALLEGKGGSVLIPIDVVTAKEFSATAKAESKSTEFVAPDDLILDTGKQSSLAIAHMLKSAGTIIWNGPVGVFEFEQFAEGTRIIANAIAQSNAFSLAGGGDTIAAIAKFGITDKISYISTGGGAFLEFLEGKKLPAIEILEERAKG